MYKKSSAPSSGLARNILKSPKRTTIAPTIRTEKCTGSCNDA